jgi:hypothetical protein
VVLIYSTKFYVFALVIGYYNGVRVLHTAAYAETRAFLFAQTPDKPCGGPPRCRSPPVPLDYAIFKTKGAARMNFKNIFSKRSGNVHIDLYPLLMPENSEAKP